MSNELVVIESTNVLAIFTERNQLDEILKQVEMEVATFEHDLSNDARRKKTASLARKVASTKTYLDSLGKDLVADWKSKSKAVDENRKVMRDRLDELRDLARKPLTDWENEQAEIEAAKAAAIEAERVKVEIENAHELAVLMNADFDRQVAELAAKKEADRLAYEAELKAQAAAQAKLEAEQAAKAESDRVEREKQEAIQREIDARAEAKRQEQMRIDSEVAAKAAAEKAEQDRIAAERRAIEAAKQAEQNRIAAEAKAKADALAAAEKARLDEVERQRKEQEAIAAEKAAREANLEHRKSINNDILNALTNHAGLSSEQAKAVVVAMAKNLIPHVEVKY